MIRPTRGDDCENHEENEDLDEGEAHSLTRFYLADFTTAFVDKSNTCGSCLIVHEHIASFAAHSNRLAQATQRQESFRTCEKYSRIVALRGNVSSRGESLSCKKMASGPSLPTCSRTPNSVLIWKRNVSPCIRTF